MNRALGTHLALFFACASLATLIWLDGQRSSEAQSYRLLRLQPGDIQSIRHLWPGGATRVDIQGPCADQDWLLSLKQPKLDNPTDNRVVPAHPVPPSDVVRRGVGLLTPLDASRRIPSPNAAERAQLGLDQPERKMILLTDQGRVELLFGQETYGGDGRYLQIVGDPDVYLASGALARSFEGPPNRLIEAQRLSLALEKITALSIGLGTEPRRFSHRHPEQAGIRRFEADDQPGIAQPGIDAIIKHLGALHSRQYQPLTRISTPAILSIDIERADCASVAIRLARNAENQGYLLQVGRWVAPMNEVAGKKFLEDIRAALPLS